MTPVRAPNKWSDLPKIILVVLAVNVAVYGCSRPAPGQGGKADRTSALEGRCAKLENDFRTVAQARDKARAELARLEEEAARLQKEVNERITAKERDELLAQLKEAKDRGEELRQALVARTAERDKLQERAERLRKGLQSMLKQDETAEVAVSAPAGAN
jgi:chromosome segregation ATPase